MKSFQLLRTNPLLTTNFKITVDTGMNLYLESIRSNSDLSNSKYGHYAINKDSYLEDTLPSFYDGLPKEQAFFVRNSDDNDVVYNDYSQQFDDIYYSGSDYITDTWYDEEFEYFAPLFVRKDDLPTGFVIMRIDGPSVYDDSGQLYELGSLNKDNFRTEIIDKWKSVAYFDMTTNSNLGFWMDKNINDNERFPLHSFEFDARKVTFSRWYGMDYETGVYTEKPMYLDKTIYYEQPHFRLEKVITDGYKNNSLIYPHIMNFNFLFDDTPATPERLRKYSINRYFGFYVDELEFITNITSYVTPPLISGTTLSNNIIISGATGLTWDICEKEYDPMIPSINPFIQDWVEGNKYYIYVKDDLHEVIRFRDPETNVWIYKLISEEILDDYWNPVNVYDKTVEIGYTQGGYSYIDPISSGFTIDPYMNCSGETFDMYSDLYLMKINDRFHVVKQGSGTTVDEETQFGDYQNILSNYYLQSDYGITSDNEKLKYWIGGTNSEYYKEFDIKNINRKPLVYSVYKVKFADIKDFDFDRVSTGFANFDYEKDKYYDTKEEKLYATEHRSTSIPKSIKLEPKGSEAQYKPVVVSSEYVSDDELYETKINGDISDIWVKNQSICKWGFQGSVSHSDYPYKFNNSIKVGSIYNRTTDVFTTYSNTLNKNLDYFYRVGNFKSGHTLDESESLFYLNQSTNIQTEYLSKIDDAGYSQNGGDGFNLSIYFEENVPTNFDFDYFDFFFSNKMSIQSNSQLFDKTYTKYSTFYGDENNQPMTLFKGLRFHINEIVDIKREGGNGSISKIISRNTDKYNGYKFSILLNDVYYDSSGSVPYKVNGVTNYDNVMNVVDNGIHVMINDIYENILVIINTNIILESNSGETFNYVSLFSEKDGLYDNKYLNGTTASSNYDPKMLVASNFINAINNMNEKYSFDNYIRYYHIRKENGSTVYSSNFINGTNDLENPPLILRISKPDLIKTKLDSFNTKLIEGPNVSKLYGRNTLNRKVNRIDEPLSRLITINDDESPTRNTYRYSGPYEPIFKDIEMFQKPIFCYTDYVTGTTTTTGTTTNNASGGKSWSQIKSTDNWKVWKNISSICYGTRSPFVNVSVPQTSDAEDETQYLALNGFEFVIPLNAEISGITVTVERKTHVHDITGGDDRYVKDHTVALSDNYDSFYYNMSDNKADTVSYWPTTYTEVDYGGLDDSWGMTWNPVMINSNQFTVVIRCSLRNAPSLLTKPPIYNVMADIKCVSVTVRYEVNQQTIDYTNFVYFDSNFRFDDTLKNFGMIDEIVYSKVNIDNKNILKFDDAKYPIVDQFGYGFSSRFIFKSDWDTEFYYNTLENFDDDSTNYYIPTTKSLKSSTSTQSTGNYGTD